MKKTLLFVAILLSGLMASAQIDIGLSGSFSFPGHSQKTGGNNVKYPLKDYTSSFSVSPSVGFRLNDAMSLGVYLDFSRTTKNYRSNTYGPGPGYGEARYWVVSQTTLYGATPYFRYNMVSYGDIRLFMELQASVSLGSVVGKEKFEGDGQNASLSSFVGKLSEQDVFGLRVIVTPGASYQITDYISADIFFNFVSLGYSMFRITDKKAYDGTTKTYKEVSESDKKQETWSKFGFNTFRDITIEEDAGGNTELVDNYVKFNQAPAIGVRLNINF